MAEAPRPLGYAAADALGLGVLWLFRLMPLRPALVLGAGLGRLLGPLAPRKAAAIRENYRLGGMPGGDAAPRRVAAELGKTVAELLWALGRPPERSLGRASLEGLEAIDEAAAEGRGVLLVAGHLANWEYVPLGAARPGVQVAVVARPLQARSIEARIHRLRAAGGVRTLLRGEPGAGVTASRWLYRGGVLGCMMDRLSAGPRVTVPFLGRATNVPLGPAIMAARAGAALVLGNTRRLADGRSRVTFRRLAAGPGSEPVELALRIGEAIEQQVRACPEQWYWIHRRMPEWTGQPVIQGERSRSPEPLLGSESSEESRASASNRSRRLSQPRR